MQTALARMEGEPEGQQKDDTDQNNTTMPWKIQLSLKPQQTEGDVSVHAKPKQETPDPNTTEMSRIS